MSTSFIDRPIHETLDVVCLATVRGCGAIIGGLSGLSSANQGSGVSSPFGSISEVLGDLGSDVKEGVSSLYRQLQPEQSTSAPCQSMTISIADVREVDGHIFGNVDNGLGGMAGVERFFQSQNVCAAR